MALPSAAAYAPGSEMAVIGVGYVGLPLALALADAGYRVHGLDADPVRVERLRSGQPGVETVESEELLRHLASSAFSPTTDWACIERCCVVAIAVPTPLRGGEPDLSPLLRVAQDLPGHVAQGTLVVLESTSYPGTTREVLLPRLARALGTVGEDFHLAFVPERIDPGNRRFSIATTPRIVGGMTPACSERAAALYRAIAGEVTIVSCPEAAETAKLFENAFRNVNIALANELGLVCEQLGLDPREVVGAAATKPFGFMPFYPGPGVGGECIPVDPRYLAWRLRRLGRPMHLLEHALDLNDEMPARTVDRIVRALNAQGTAVRSARVLLLGVSYKEDVGDTRNAPALKVLEGLRAQGVEVAYHDPHVPEVEVQGRRLRSEALTDRLLRDTDLAVALVAHRGVDYAGIAQSAALLDLSAGRGLPVF